MARPTKNTVEYFPLDCRWGDSLTAIENMYGNDGFVVWVKTLQKLGSSNNHFIDVRKNKDWVLFVSRFKIEETKVREILDTLAEFECIDKELWVSHVVYSENFVKGIEDVYRFRKEKAPQRADIFKFAGLLDLQNEIDLKNILANDEKTVSHEGNDSTLGVKHVENEVKHVGNQQSKLNKSKLNKKKNIKEKKSFKKFTPPTLEEIKAYCLQRKNNIDPQRFFDYYHPDWVDANGKEVLNWKQKVITWEGRGVRQTVNVNQQQEGGKYECID